jgi:hypothetical protein
MADEIDGDESDGKVGKVTSSVLDSFFEELAKTDDLKDISANLRRLVVDDGVFAEPAVRAVLFADAP